METGKNIRSAAGHIKTHINTFNLNTNTNGSSMSVHVAFGICFKHIHTLHLVDRYDCVRKKRRMKKKKKQEETSEKVFAFPNPHAYLYSSTAQCEAIRSHLIVIERVCNTHQHLNVSCSQALCFSFE